LKTLTDRYRCYFCQVPEPLFNNSDNFRKLIEIHHINERHNGGKDNSDNLIPVCSNCHSKIHLGLINPIRWIFTTSGYKLIWTDLKGTKYIGEKVLINNL
jgi:hypothetical protein